MLGGQNNAHPSTEQTFFLDFAHGAIGLDVTGSLFSLVVRIAKPLGVDALIAAGDSTNSFGHEDHLPGSCNFPWEV